jgi:tetratricopeptide (TPR) repeat protein
MITRLIPISSSRRLRLFVILSLFCVTLLSSSCSLIKTKSYYIASGRRYANKGQLREAAIQYLNAIKQDPQSATAHHELGRIAIRMGDVHSAELELAQAAQLDPKDLQTKVDYGHVLITTGKFDEAERQAQSVLSKEPDNADAHIIMSRVNGARDDSHRALLEAQEAVKAKPTEADAQIALAGAHVQLREFGEAENVLKTAVSQDPKSVQLLMALGDLYLIQKKFDLSEATFKRAIATDKKNAQPRARLLNQYIVLHKWDSAKEVAVQAKADNPKDPLSYRMMGDFLLWTGDLNGALAEYDKAVKEHPYDYVMARAYVQLLIFGDRIEQADKLNKQVMKQFGADPMSLIARGQILLRQGNPSDAASALKSALRVAQNNYLAHLNLGIALQQLNDPVGAERELREAARLRPGTPGTQFMLAELGRSSRNVELLFDTAENLLQAYPRSASAYVLRGTAAFAWKQNTAGEADFKKAIEVDPKSPVGYAALGQLRMEQGKMAEAEKLLRQSLEVDPTYSYALRELAELLNRTGRANEGIALVSEKLAQSPNNANYQTILGELQFQQKQYAQAESHFKKATELNPELDSAWQLLGQTQAAEGNLDGTIATYQRWANASLLNALPYVLLGQVNESRQDWTLAEKAYRKALERDPSNPIAANNLANGLLERSGDAQAALSLALIALKSDPNSTIVADTVGLAYLRQGKTQQAIETFNQALRSDDRNASLHYHLAKALTDAGDMRQAAVHMGMAQKLDPQFVASNEEREKVQAYFQNQQKKQ